MIEINAKKISQSRTMIMGIAMILIVFFHSSVDTSKSITISCFKSMGDIGVDIFLMMSGIGIYHSLNKNGNLRSFYKKRLVRILPAYLMIDGVWFAVFDIALGGGVKQFLFDISTFSFWISGSLCAWYIAVILLLYFLTPLYLKLIEKKSNSLYRSMLIIWVLAIVIRLSNLTIWFGHLLVFLFRIPSYLFGLKLGEWLIEDKKVKLNSCSLLGVFVALGVCIISLGYTSFYLPWAFKYITYFPIGLFIVCIVSVLPRMKMINFFGIYSLEIYLLHEKVLWVLTNIKDKYISVITAIDRYNIGINAVAIVITCFGAWLLNLICRKIQKVI